MRISDWSSDVCSSDLSVGGLLFIPVRALRAAEYLHSLRQLSLWLGCTRAWPDDGRHRRLQHHRAGRAGATDSRTAWRAPHAVDRSDFRNARLCRFWSRADGDVVSRRGTGVCAIRIGQSRLAGLDDRSEEHTSELQSLMRI